MSSSLMVTILGASHQPEMSIYSKFILQIPSSNIFEQEHNFQVELMLGSTYIDRHIIFNARRSKAAFNTGSETTVAGLVFLPSIQPVF